MKTFSLPWRSAFAAAWLAGAILASGATILTESFDYPAGDIFNGKSGGTGFDGGWIESDSSSPQDLDTILNESLQFGSLAVSGNALRSVAPNSFSSSSFRATAGSIAGTSGRVLWCSFLIRKTSEGTSSPNNYCGLALYPTDANAVALYIGDTGETDFYSLGIAGSPNGQVASNSPSVVSASATFLVAKITFRDGPDTVELFVNPDPMQPAPTQAAATKSDLDLADISGLGILAGQDATWNVDEIRIGDTFADVAPPAPGHVVNISTRLRVDTGENVLIGGFIIQGHDKKVIVRAIGPSLRGQNVPDALADPVLQLFDSSKQLLAQNDNWRSSQESEIIATGVPPTSDLESAIVTTLPAGNYTAVVSGQNSGTGVGLVEAFDLSPATDSQLANISTRGLVQGGDNVMIGGLIVQGATTKRIIARGIGPSLRNSGVANALADPLLEIHDANGALLAQNDNWRTAQQQEIIATGVAPSDDLESAIVIPLQPGRYTAVLRGSDGGTGVGLVEVYGL